MSFWIQFRTLLENRRTIRDGPDFANTKADTNHEERGRVCKFMIAQLNRVTNEAVSDRRVIAAINTTKGVQSVAMSDNFIDYYNVLEEEDLFPETSTLNPLQINEKHEL